MFKVIINDNNCLKVYYEKDPINGLEFLINHGYYINASCGGKGTCGTCHFIIDGKKKLSCQTILEQDIEIELSPNTKIKKSYKVKVPKNHKIGVGIDLGTTTLAFYLLDLDMGEVLLEYSELNNQAVYGADIISRIDFARTKSLEQIHLTLINQIKNNLNDLIETFQIKIDKLVVAGNTVQTHLFLNVNPESLGRIPFEPVFINRRDVKGSELGLPVKDIIVYPGIAGFVGGDIVSGLVAVDFLKEFDKNKLFVDIGTNGEIVLLANSKIYSTSTAAGPAFEGAKIEMGLGGVAGAISKVRYENDKLKINTVENKEAIGICGSGLVDMISILVREKIIDETGAWAADFEHPLLPKLVDQKFYITEQVYITQRDIREFQLAKSAIASGIQTILHESNISYSDLDEVYIAGGFGFYLDKFNGIILGLLPFDQSTNIINIGNSGGLGTVIGSFDDKLITEGEKLSEQVKVVELATNTYFVNKFIDNMGFEVIIDEN